MGGLSMGDLNIPLKESEKAALVIDPADNVAVVLCDFKKGESCTVRFEDKREQIKVLSDVFFGHKIALTPIEKNERVFKYGEEIGRMKNPIQRGDWIHSHNMYCERGMKHGR